MIILSHKKLRYCVPFCLRSNGWLERCGYLKNLPVFWTFLGEDTDELSAVRSTGIGDIWFGADWLEFCWWLGRVLEGGPWPWEEEARRRLTGEGDTPLPPMPPAWRPPPDEGEVCGGFGRVLLVSLKTKAWIKSHQLIAIPIILDHTIEASSYGNPSTISNRKFLHNREPV